MNQEIDPFQTNPMILKKLLPSKATLLFSKNKEHNIKKNKILLIGWLKIAGNEIYQESAFDKVLSIVLLEVEEKEPILHPWYLFNENI